MFFRSRLDAAAKGPGVGGIKTWGANNPVDKATVRPTNGVFVWLANVLFNRERITKAASQNTGIETIYPIILTAKGKGSLEKYFKTLEAITIVPLDFSKITPIMVPKTISRPMVSIIFKNPDFINELASKFGCQCVVVAIDAKFEDNDWYVYLVGGRVKTEIKLFDWAKEVEKRGAGEILFTSMDNDGTKNGFSNKALSKLSNMVNIPVIASGGAGKIEHFIDVFKKGCADAALAASVFHFNEIDINTLKKELKNNKIPVRLWN